MKILHVASFLLAVVISLNISGCATTRKSDQPMGERIAPRELTESEKQIISNVVIQKLVDPESARFKWNTLLNSKGYCGLVNAKNRMGGYNGDTPYLVSLYFEQNSLKSASFFL